MHHSSFTTCDKCGKQYESLLYGGRLHHYDLSHKLSHENWGEPQPDLDFCPDCYPKVYKMFSEVLQVNRKLKIKKSFWIW